MVPQSTNQGATYPCKEDVARNLGSMVDLTGAAAAQLARDNVELVVNVTEGGEKTDRSYGQKIGLGQVAKIVESVVYWNAAQIANNYRSSPSSPIIGFEQLHNTVIEWWMAVIGTLPSTANVGLPQAMMQYLIFEEGIPWGSGGQKKKWLPAMTYTPFSCKLAIYTQKKGWVYPTHWSQGKPSALSWALLKAAPPGLSEEQGVEPACPCGSGYYGVVRLCLDPEGRIAEQTGILEAIPCKEQLLNRETNAVVEAWPAGTLAIRPVHEEDEGAQFIDERRLRHLRERNGCWAPADEEIERSHPHEPEEFDEGGGADCGAGADAAWETESHGCTDVASRLERLDMRSEASSWRS